MNEPKKGETPMTKDEVSKMLNEVLLKVSSMNLAQGHRGIKYIEKREWQAGYIAALKDVRKKLCGG